jgi:hypothetical protein
MPTSVAVNALVAEPMKNGVFGVTGVFVSTSATPNPLAKITSSPRTIATTAPGACKSDAVAIEVRRQALEPFGERGRRRRRGDGLRNGRKGQSEKDGR